MLGIFKKKKPVKKEKLRKKKEVKKPPEVKIKKKAKEKPKEEKVRTAIPKAKPEISELVYKTLKAPHITEKATDLAQKNQYIFKVLPKANKVEVKKAIQQLYGVKVNSVNIINIPRKRRRLGKSEGWKKGYKKAIVRLAKGEKIDVAPR